MTETRLAIVRVGWEGQRQVEEGPRDGYPLTGINQIYGRFSAVNCHICDLGLSHGGGAALIHKLPSLKVVDTRQM